VLPPVERKLFITNRLRIALMAESRAGENTIGKSTRIGLRRELGWTPHANKTRQVNILATDMGYPLEDIVIYPTTAALGYGVEYICSILDRGQPAARSGDRLPAQPVVLSARYEDQPTCG